MKYIPIPSDVRADTKRELAALATYWEKRAFDDGVHGADEQQDDRRELVAGAGRLAAELDESGGLTRQSLEQVLWLLEDYSRQCPEGYSVWFRSAIGPPSGTVEVDQLRKRLSRLFRHSL